MKKTTFIVVTILVILIGMFIFTNNNVYATEKAIDNETESKLIEIKETEKKSMEDYQKAYGSETYGTVAYILEMVRIYSIPFCFLGIAIGAIHKYILGVRKLDTLEKGMRLIITFITLLVICQILPLAFTIVVRFNRG